MILLQVLTDVLIANLIAFEFWRTHWLRPARAKYFAHTDGAAVLPSAASAAAAAATGFPSEEGCEVMDEAQKDWCNVHGLVPLALAAVHETVDSILQVQRAFHGY